MTRLRPLPCVLAIAGALAASGAGAQQYPARTVRIVVPYAPGGNTDIIGRAVARKLTDALGHQFVVDNRPGGGTNIGTEVVAKAAPDGYTLLMAGASNAINMSYYPKLGYDTLRDFTPIVLCGRGSNVLSVNPALPARNLKELIALAKANPGKMSYGSSGLGSSNMMAGELLKLMAGINIVHVPYKGNSPAMTDVIGGQIEMMFSGVPSILPMVQAKKLRAVAIGSAKRFAAIPDVPTFEEAGLPGYRNTNWFGLVAPTGTPREAIQRINAEVIKGLGAQDMKDRFAAEGLELPAGTPESFGQWIREEITLYAKIVKAAGLRAEQ